MRVNERLRHHTENTMSKYAAILTEAFGLLPSGPEVRWAVSRAVSRNPDVYRDCGAAPGYSAPRCPRPEGAGGNVGCELPQAVDLSRRAIKRLMPHKLLLPPLWGSSCWEALSGGSLPASRQNSHPRLTAHRTFGPDSKQTATTEAMAATRNGYSGIAGRNAEPNVFNRDVTFLQTAPVRQ